MANKKFWVGILVMVLVFGMSVIGCDNGNDNGGDTNALDTVNWSTAPLSEQAGEISGLSQSQFETIRNASGGGFLGWVIEDGELVMAWTGRSAANFNSVVSAIVGLPGRTEENREVEAGIHFVEGNNFVLIFNSVRTSYDGLYVPAGTLIAVFF